MANSDSDSPSTNSHANIACETKGLSRHGLVSYKFKVLMDQGKISVKKACKAQKEGVQNGYRSLKMRKEKEKEKEKGDWSKPGKLSPVKKLSSVISGVFGHKKTECDGDRCDHRAESGKDDQKMTIVNLKEDKKKSMREESIRKIKRISSSIMSLSRRLKKRRSRREKGSEGEERNGEVELCKRRILMGEKCKPLNASGALHYDGEGLLLPEP